MNSKPASSVLPIADQRSINASYAWARRLCKASKSSFFRSFSLLEPERRNAMFSLYAFSRITDDLGDSEESSEIRRVRLAAWRQQTAATLGHTIHDEPTRQDNSESRAVVAEQAARFASLWPGLADAHRRFEIPPKLLDDIIVGVSMDIDHQQPSDWTELNQYCYHVASAVGLACTHIWRSEKIAPVKNAIDCGIAFQLTNILRDVAEDANTGRIYLPSSELEKYGISQSTWLAGAPDGDWLELVQAVGRTASDLYDEGWDTIHSLTPDSQRMFSLMWRSYRSLLDQVLARDQDLWIPPKTRLPWTTKARLIASHFIPPLYTRLPSPKRCQD